MDSFGVNVPVFTELFLIFTSGLPAYKYWLLPHRLSLHLPVTSLNQGDNQTILELNLVVDDELNC